MAQYKGEVAWFNNLKGYGFLTAEGIPDVFIHYSAILIEGYKSVREGEQVEFDIQTGSTGKPQAANVKLLER